MVIITKKSRLLNEIVPPHPRIRDSNEMTTYWKVCQNVFLAAITGFLTFYDDNPFTVGDVCRFANLTHKTVRPLNLVVATLLANLSYLF